MIEIDSVYSPQKYEAKVWEIWKKAGLFTSSSDSEAEPYTILMPPPNVTSQLHMGHGLGYSIQDLLIRWKRMEGFNVLWLPGTDHAGIATQMMVEKQLEQEGKKRTEIGRDSFVRACMDWKEKYGGLILEQFAKMGFSCDWSRTAYTMDEHLSHAVRYVFVKLYEEGLIYRGERLVNWDTVLQTAISDDEVENVEKNGHIWYFRYPIEGSHEFIPIATTRPETMLGDTAIAVNPNDERYTHLHGKNAILPFCHRSIPIVTDDYVKSEFGTGAVKITPAHDPNDFAIGKRHRLKEISILNDDGTINANAPKEFRGLDRFEARKLVLKKLKDANLFDEEKPYRHSIPHSERSKSIIEPKLSKQWFVKMQNMAKDAAQVARDGDIRFYPETWKKTYLYWLDNIQDWCISRQLWWGHRIPIWYCQNCQETNTGINDPTECKSCGSSEIVQDEDVLDTWFSSWLWPLSPFGWPEDSGEQDLNYFYPTNTLVTAPEIIFLWVARMVMAGKKFRQKPPFRDIYFNATVCDKKGRKFSKTLGNGIDPLDVIEKHGADAVRFTAVSLAPLGGRVRMAVEDFDNGSRFINKLWNASRFLMSHLEPNTLLKPMSALNLKASEKWLLNELNEVTGQIRQLLKQYRINEAIEKMYHFIWGSLCDWGLESAKEDLDSTDLKKKETCLSVLVYVFEGGLRLCHPIIPFVTEELWQKLPMHPDWLREQTLAQSHYPNEKSMPAYGAEAADWQLVQKVTSAIRSTRTQAGIPHKEVLEVILKPNPERIDLLTQSTGFISRLAKVKINEINPNAVNPGKSLTAVDKEFSAYIPVAGLIDIEKEKQRLLGEKTKITAAIKGLEKKLSSDQFKSKAPPDVVRESELKFENFKMILREIELNLDSLH